MHQVAQLLLRAQRVEDVPLRQLHQQLAHGVALHIVWPDLQTHVTRGIIMAAM